MEDQGFVDAGGVGIYPDIVTRDLYAAGIGYEYTVERMWVRHYRHTSPTSLVNVTPYWRNTESEFETPTVGSYDWREQKTFTTDKGAPLVGSPAGLMNAGALSRIDIHLGSYESFVWRFQEPNGGGGLAMTVLGYEFEGHGLEESRRG